jgi:hypothetical protein
VFRVALPHLTGTSKQRITTGKGNRFVRSDDTQLTEAGICTPPEWSLALCGGPEPGGMTGLP